MSDRTGAPDRPTDLEAALGVAREVAMTGLAVLVPAFISAYVLLVVFGFVERLLRPLAKALPGESGAVSELLALVALIGAVFAVGFIAHFRRGKRAIDYFDATMSRVPGLGTVYESFRRMSDVLLEDDARHFREVKLVAFPDDDVYVIGFETASPSGPVADALDEDDLVTLFVPMAPNPFMGGFVVTVPPERVRDVEMSVEDGVRTIVTSGVAIDGDREGRSAAEPPWEFPRGDRLPDADRLRSLTVADLRSLDLASVESVEADEFGELDVADLRSLDLRELEGQLIEGEPRDRGEEGGA